MTVTKDEAQMLATLACNVRPAHARQWNPADVMAEIAKLADRNLGAVICAVTRCAMDRGAERPSCIGSNGSHWSDSMVPQAFVPRVLDAGERCSICSKAEHACRTTQGVDMQHGIDPHEFKSAAIAAKEAADAAEHVAQARAAITTTAPRPEPLTREDFAAKNPELAARVQAVRDANPALHEIPEQMTEQDQVEEAAE